MSPISSRPYFHPDDLPALVDFLKAVRPAEWINEYPSIVDLQESMGRESIRGKTRLWTDEQDRLSAFAFVLEPYNNLAFEIKPDAGHQIENELITWAIKSADASLDSLDTSCREDDLLRIALLERNGFIRREENTLRLARSLEEPIPPPLLPAGCAIRPIAGESEADAIVSLHRSAFGTSNMTREERLAIMRASEYDPTLDLVVAASDGRLAGYCTCSISSVENKLTGIKVGHTDPVAVHPEFQRRGLACALLLKGAQLLKERGMEMAMLGTSSDNLSMQKAAQAAGFRVYSKRIWFSRTISDA
jgi:ribosomal protein S18 acetylase RimI-like enzyme